VQQVNVNATNLAKVLIPVPIGAEGLEEQRDIAAVLESVHSVIEAHRRVLLGRKALKRALTQDLLTGHVRLKSRTEVQR
jgi:hypothetical protein